MATIQSAIALNDGFSPQVAKMVQGMNKMTSSCQKLDSSIQKVDSSISASSGGMGNFSSYVNGAGSAVDSFISSSIAKFGLLSAAIFGAYQAVKQFAGFISGAMNLSDKYSLTNSRLNLINDGLQTTGQLQDKIFLSAMRTGNAYRDTVSTIAKFGTLASHAFKGNDEIILFAEQMNKQFTIGGASLQERSNAMYQLTQAMASGRLQGDEYRSIIENAPLLAQSIADYAGVGLDKLKEMSSNGELTSDLIKKSLFSMVDETNAKFEKIPITFGRAFTMIENVAYRSFQSVWEALGSIANNKNLQDLLASLMPALNVVAALVAGTIYNFKALVSAVVPIIQYVFGTFGTMAENALNMVSALFSATFPVMIGLLAGYAAYWVLTNSLMLKNMIVSAASAVWQGILAAATWVLTTAKAAWVAVTRGVILTQMILGVVLAALSSPILVIGALIVGAIAIFSAWAAAGGNLREVLASAFEGIVNATEWMVNSSVKLINLLISAYNKAGSVLGKVLGFEFTEVGTVEYQADFSGFRDKYAGAIRNGTLLDTIQGDLGLNGIDGIGGVDGGFDPDALQALQDTAGNTKGMKEAMEITDEDLKYFRDIAERDFIQQYQVAEIRVDMSGMSNNITKEADVQDIASILRDTIEEEMIMSAEGVHL